MRKIGFLVDESPIIYDLRLRKQITLFRNLFPDYKTDIIGPTGKFEIDDSDFDHRPSYHKLKRRIINAAFLPFSLWWYLKNSNPDVLMIMGEPLITAPLAVGLYKIFHVPVIIRLGSYPFGKYKLYKGPKKVLRFFLRDVVGKLSLKSANRLIVLGPYAKDMLIKENFPKDKIWIIPTLIDKNTFKPPTNKENSKRELGFPPLSKVVLFVGRLDRLKGAHILKSVAEKVREQRKDILFCVVGEGEYKDKLNALSNVRTVGFIMPTEIHKYYEAADLLILPSQTEGLPNVVLEALACRVPVVATNIGEIPWIVSNTFKDVQGFVDYIVNGNWKVDVLPEIFFSEECKRSYESVIESLF